MQRLTQKDDQGNWCLKCVLWSKLRVGQAITKEIYEKLYGALRKLMDYEDTGLSPEEVESLKDFEGSNAQKYLLEIAKHGWIPVSEQLPEKDGIYLATIDGVLAGEYEPFVGLAMFDGGKWVEDDDDYRYVIAWMPLPAPYNPAPVDTRAAQQLRGREEFFRD